MEPINVDNIARLSNYLRTDLNSVRILSSEEYLINDYCSVKDFSKVYDSILRIDKFCIPKRRQGAGFREVYKPTAETLINCLKILNNHLNKLYIAPECVHGFIKGRGIKTNANNHLGKKFILTVDIHDFFESINIEMLIEALCNKGFSYEISKSIANIVTVEKKLIQGFHTSPTLANIVFEKIDKELQEVDKNIIYTRYADDLTFSSDNEIECYTTIKKIIENHGFRVNERKTKVMKRGQNQYVTGLTVFDSTYPRIPKRVKKQIRLEIHYIKEYGIVNHVLNRLGITPEEYYVSKLYNNEVKKEIAYSFSTLYGWLMYINGIEPYFTKRYHSTLRYAEEKYNESLNI